jgi:hypothetical protein
MEWLQIDIMGNEVKVKDPEKPPRKLKTMQELHGTLEGKTCKTCRYKLRHEYHDYVYYKCQLWRLSHSNATDIRLKDKACRKYEEG